MPFGKAKETRAFGSVRTYIQGPGEISKLPRFARMLGKKALLLIDGFFYDAFSEEMPALFHAEALKAVCVKFSGECNVDEIDRVYKLGMAEGADVYVGIGGGKTCDTARAASANAKTPLIVCPTNIATDAPTGSSVMVYNSDLTSYNVRLGKNPDYVILDTEITVKAPLRSLVAGFGDAIATWIEARANIDCDNINYIGNGYRRTLAGLAIAKAAFDTILEKGQSALLAAKNGIRTEDYEDIAEANTLLSGAGTENSGCSLAHGICVALHTLPVTGHLMHGELVAFGALAELIIEQRSMDEFERIRRFCKAVGLPTSLDALGITDNKRENIEHAVEKSLENPLSLLYIQSRAVSKDRIVNGILFADAYDREEQIQ
ncbi:MAG: glycerol dehydrogenase [Clostridiales Family XIII bacterium]|nr:glycerol dehydrogenase [Clostridiales Family XIII bacterium]